MQFYKGYAIYLQEKENNLYTISVSTNDEFNEIVYESHNIIKENIDKEIELAKTQIDHLIVLREEL